MFSVTIVLFVSVDNAMLRLVSCSIQYDGTNGWFHVAYNTKELMAGFM